MDLGIQGRWALVCGGSKGLGYGCASALVQAGVNVVVNARDGAILDAARVKLQDLGMGRGSGGSDARVLTVAADITTVKGRASALAVPGGPGIDFDIVVTNAGGPPPGDFRDWDRDAWVRAIESNMLTPIELIKSTVDGMASRGFGRIINITSSAVKAPINVLGLSNGARSGLTGFVAGLARSAIAGKGVTINNILPGRFDTERLASGRSYAAKKTGKTEEQIATAQMLEIPVGRFGAPEEFGALCAFLCSVHGAYITGQNLLIDGGMYPGTY